MRSFVLIIVLVVGAEMSASAFDIPPPKDLNQIVQLSEERSTFQQFMTAGTVVGGALLAAGMLFGGLWLSRRRKATSSV